jgi:hypothetical protein
MIAAGTLCFLGHIWLATDRMCPKNGVRGAA